MPNRLASSILPSWKPQGGTSEAPTLCFLLSSEDLASSAQVTATIPMSFLKGIPLLEIQIPSKVQKVLPGAGYQALLECATKINLCWYGNGSNYFKKKKIAPSLSHVVMATGIRKVTWPRRLCSTFWDWEFSEEQKTICELISLSPGSA